MNKERVKQYITICLKNIRQEDLTELEKDIEMPLVTFFTELLDNIYKKYSKAITFVPVNLDSYKDYIIAPKNVVYPSEDLLLNRLLRSVTSIIYRNESHTFSPNSHYAHEFLHGIKTQFYDGDFFDADRDIIIWKKN